jgi:hypothetical protein
MMIPVAEVLPNRIGRGAPGSAVNFSGLPTEGGLLVSRLDPIASALAPSAANPATDEATPATPAREKAVAVEPAAHADVAAAPAMAPTPVAASATAPTMNAAVLRPFEIKTS